MGFTSSRRSAGGQRHGPPDVSPCRTVRIAQAATGSAVPVDPMVEGMRSLADANPIPAS